MKLYYLGNCLRGYIEGSFSDMETAWKVLSARFLLSFPSTSGRKVILLVKEENAYGFEQALICKSGLTSLEPVDEEETDKCKSSYFYI